MKAKLSSMVLVLTVFFVISKISYGCYNPPPVVYITYPTNGAAFTEGDNITITANALDTYPGHITKVRFYIYENDQLIEYGNDYQKPYEYTWTALAGVYTLKARAFDNGGKSTLSDSVNIAVDVIYVDTDAEGNNDGTNWEDAFNYLQDALDAALPGDQIWVAEGTYYPDEDNIEPRHTDNARVETFSLHENVKLYGGFAGGETNLNERDWTANETILSGEIGNLIGNGDNSYHVVKVDNVDNAVLDGFTITKGCAFYSPSDGAGMYNNYSSSRVENCIFSNNCAKGYGGGIYNKGGEMSVNNCMFRDNYVMSYGSGGGICNYEGEMSVSNCVFRDNYHGSSYGDCGGGIYNAGEMSVSNCVFRGNKVNYCGGGIYNYGNIENLSECAFIENEAMEKGGGIFNGANGATIQNINSCTFNHNIAYSQQYLGWGWGGGIYSYGNIPMIVNSVFSGNLSNGAGGGIFYFGTVPMAVINCTFSANRSYYGACGIEGRVEGIVNVSNSVLWGTGESGESQIGTLWCGNVNVNNSCIQYYVPGVCWDGVGNTGEDPQFVNPNDPDGSDNIPGTADDGLRLNSSNSPCANTGDNSVVPLETTTDVKGHARFNGVAVDMGAYELGDLDVNQDSDEDGMPDWWENRYGLNPNDPDDANGDFDGDGLTNLGEYQTGTGPTNPDTDDDGMPDGYEVENGLNPFADDGSEDPDQDGLTNLSEYQTGTDPANPDTDGDGLSDGDEISEGTNPTNPDTDGDALSDGDEISFGTDPTDPDTDDDTLSDGDEVLAGTDPNDWDTDDDLFSDGWEVEHGLDPLVTNDINSDTDGDGLNLLEELIYGTNPALADTDGDGTNDGIEASSGGYPTDPTDDGEAPTADQICELRLTVGDHSSSESERYDLVIYESGESSPFVIHHQGPEFGVVTSGNYNQFRPGKRYEIKLKHLATNWVDGPDCDYTASVEPLSIPEGVICEIEDPEQILQVYWTQDHPEFPYTYFYPAGKTAYVNLIKVDVTDIKFDHSSGDTSDGIAIYDVTVPEWVKGGQNEPVAYKKNTDVAIKAKFTVSPTSSSITSAKIRATTSDSILGNLGEQTINFSGGVSNPEYITFTPSNATPISIGEETITWQWKAKDLNGQSSSEYNIGTSGSHKIYAVYDSPKCASSEYTKDHLFQATEFGDGGIEVSQICSNVQFYLHANQNFKKNTGPNGESGVWNIIFPGGLGNQGDCIAHANLMKVSLKVLGVDASYAYVADATNQPSEDSPVYKRYWCSKNNREERRWFKYNTGDAPWNFEGVCGIDGIYYDVALSTTSGTYDYCKTTGNGIVYQWVYMFESSPNNWLSCGDQNDVHIPLD